LLAADYFMNSIIPSAGSRYSDEDRRRAVAYFVVLGDCEKVSQAVGIPARTLRDWKNSQWFSELVAEVRREKDAELDAQFNGAIHAAAEQLFDRINNGDFAIVGGKLHRKPMAGRDLAVTAAILFDKRQLLRNQPTIITGDSPDNKLARLAEMLQRLAGAREIEQTPCDRTIEQESVG
jgi:hypothetical protein